MCFRETLMHIRSELSEEFTGTNNLHRICVEIELISSKLAQVFESLNYNYFTFTEL